MVGGDNSGFELSGEKFGEGPELRRRFQKFAGVDIEGRNEVVNKVLMIFLGEGGRFCAFGHLGSDEAPPPGTPFGVAADDFGGDGDWKSDYSGSGEPEFQTSWLANVLVLGFPWMFILNYEDGKKGKLSLFCLKVYLF